MKFATLFFVLAIAGCGTQDYEDPSPGGTETADEQPIVIVDPYDGEVEGESTQEEIVRETSGSAVPSSIMRESRDPGFMWSGLNWVGLPDNRVDDLKCRLADQPVTDEYTALGTAVVGGAVIGVVIRASGVWFFGRPYSAGASTQPSGPDSGPSRAFWSRFGETIKGVPAAFLRGAVIGGVCQSLVTGGSLNPFPGLLGEDFMALSTAMTLGGMSGVAIAPWARRAFGRPPTLIGPPNIPPNTGGRILAWTNNNPLGRGIHYHVAPNLAIVGLSTGVGVLIFEQLRGGSIGPAFWNERVCPER